MGKNSGLRSWNHKIQLCVCDYSKVFVNSNLIGLSRSQQAENLHEIIRKTAYLRQQDPVLNVTAFKY